MGNINACMDIIVYSVFLYYLIEPEVHFLVNSSFVLIPYFFSSFTHGKTSLKVFAEVVNFSLYFSFFWRKSLVWNDSTFELGAKYHFQHYGIHFAFWIFPAMQFQSLMKLVGRDVPPLSSHLMERGSLPTGYIHVKSEPCRIHFKHSSLRRKASQLGVDRSSQNALQ